MLVIWLIESDHQLNLSNVQGFNHQHIRLIPQLLQAPSVVCLLENVGFPDGDPFGDSAALLDYPFKFQPLQATERVA